MSITIYSNKGDDELNRFGKAPVIHEMRRAAPVKDPYGNIISQGSEKERIHLKFMGNDRRYDFAIKSLSSQEQYELKQHRREVGYFNNLFYVLFDINNTLVLININSVAKRMGITTEEAREFVANGLPMPQSSGNQAYAAQIYAKVTQGEVSIREAKQLLQWADKANKVIAEEVLVELKKKSIPLDSKEADDFFDTAYWLQSASKVDAVRAAGELLGIRFPSPEGDQFLNLNRSHSLEDVIELYQYIALEGLSSNKQDLLSLIDAGFSIREMIAFVDYLKAIRKDRKNYLRNNRAHLINLKKQVPNIKAIVASEVLTYYQISVHQFDILNKAIADLKASKAPGRFVGYLSACLHNGIDFKNARLLSLELAKDNSLENETCMQMIQLAEQENIYSVMALKEMHYYIQMGMDAASAKNLALVRPIGKNMEVAYQANLLLDSFSDLRLTFRDAYLYLEKNRHQPIHERVETVKKNLNYQRALSCNYDEAANFVSYQLPLDLILKDIEKSQSEGFSREEAYALIELHVTHKLSESSARGVINLMRQFNCSALEARLIQDYMTEVNTSSDVAYLIIKRLLQAKIKPDEIQTIVLFIKTYFEQLKEEAVQKSSSLIINRRDFKLMDAKGKEVLLPRMVQLSLDGQPFLLFNRRTTQGDKVLGRGAYKKAIEGLNLLTGVRVTALSQLFENPKKRALILKEIETEKALSGHEGLASVVSGASASYINKKNQEKLRSLMEHFDGGELVTAVYPLSLTDNPKKFPVPTRKEKILVLVKTLRGLKWLHENGWVDRDRKIQNIMLKRDPNSLEIVDAAHIDFGFTVKVDQLDITNKAGTPHYMPPEYFKNDLIDRNSAKAIDIWGLGICYYQLFHSEVLEWAGEPDSPEWFDSSLVKNLNDLYHVMENLQNDWLPKPVDSNSIGHLIYEMLRVNPADRITADALLVRAEAIAMQEGVNV